MAAMDVLTPDSAARAKRKRPGLAPASLAPLCAGTAAAADADEEEDLDSPRQHKRYVTEVIANGLSCALSLHTPRGAGGGAGAPPRRGEHGAAAMDMDCSPPHCAAAAAWAARGGPECQDHHRQQRQQQQRERPGASAFPASLQWPPRRGAAQAWQQAQAAAVAPLQQQQQLPLQHHLSLHAHERQPHPWVTAQPPAPCDPGAVPQQPQQEAAGGGAAGRFDLRKATLLRSLLQRTEEYLGRSSQGGASAAGAGAAGQAAAGQQGPPPQSLGGLRPPTPLPGDPEAALPGLHRRVFQGGYFGQPQQQQQQQQEAGAAYDEGSSGQDQQRQLSWLRPFWQTGWNLSAAFAPPPAAAPPAPQPGHHHQQQQQPAQQHHHQQPQLQRAQAPGSPGIPRETLERVRAIALAAGAAAPLHADGAAPPCARKEAGGGGQHWWSLSAWRGAPAPGEGGAAAQRGAPGQV
ncbi:MAG: hypothetical protein J3K34DRAFT_110113 [Monoraphidium minutum]|nr:MAG: hypothetical protein J3K34DRAFT_110113 [Monoraphidium minutum]